MTIRQHNILIIGGGPAGLATALHLARHAPSLIRDLLVIEARTYPRPKLCGGGITFHGEEQLQQLGIHLTIPDFTVNRLVFRLGKQEFVVQHPGAMRVIQRAEFDAALADAAQAAGIQMHTGEKLLEIQPVAHGVEIVTNQAQYFAKVVIAADGANSTIRRKLRFTSEEGIARLLRVMTPLDPSADSAWTSQTALFDFSCIQRGVQGYAWDFPCYVDGAPYMNRGIFDSRMIEPATKPAHGTFKNTFGAWLADRDVDLNACTLEGHPVRWFTPHAEYSRPHVLLTGDAAGVDVLFAEGISYAMEYGMIAADTVIDAFKHDNFSFSDYRHHLLNHRLGKLLLRRAAVAAQLYEHRYPPAWTFLWQMAAVAPRRVQRAIGAWLAVLPA
jgi:flavin-dependent dehydrogenase